MDIAQGDERGGNGKQRAEKKDGQIVDIDIKELQINVFVLRKEEFWQQREDKRHGADGYEQRYDEHTAKLQEKHGRKVFLLCSQHLQDRQHALIGFDMSADKIQGKGEDDDGKDGAGGKQQLLQLQKASVFAGVGYAVCRFAAFGQFHLRDFHM